jgi:hypothetical protein
VLCAVALLSLVGCRSSGSWEKKREFSRIAHAVQVVRDAPNAEKRAPLEALKAQECALLCEFHRLCVRAYEMHVDGLTSLEEARTLSRGEDSIAASSALVKAEKTITDAHRLTTACAALEGEYQRKLAR